MTSNKPKSSGFTLLEITVVLAIIVIITTITLTSQGSFNKSIILANTSYDVALLFRTAETYGVGSRASSADITRNAGYGLHFERARASNIILFSDFQPSAGYSTCHPNNNTPSDQPGNCVYDSGEQVNDYLLGNRIYVSDFCAKFSGLWKCANSNGGELSNMDVVFSRPNPDPIVTAGSWQGGTTACVTMASQYGGVRHVGVYASGSIVANAVSCPLP